MSANTLDLEKKWEVWCQYLEEQKELDTMTAAARERLLNLLCRRETGHRLTKKTILKELEVFWKCTAASLYNVQIKQTYLFLGVSYGHYGKSSDLRQLQLRIKTN